MDALARLHPGAAGLLAQVDDTLTRHGAPPGHRIWPLLRAVGALPGDSVAAVAAWSPQPWRQRADALRLACRHGQANADLLHELSGWDGAAGEAFGVRLAAVRTDAENLAERIDATAQHCELLHQWLADSRDELARTLADVLSSAEAVALVTGWAAPAPGAVPGDGWGDPEHASTARAAAGAEIGATLLSRITRLTEAGESLLATGADRLAPAGATRPASTFTMAADLSSTATLNVEL